MTIHIFVRGIHFLFLKWSIFHPILFLYLSSSLLFPLAFSCTVSFYFFFLIFCTLYNFFFDTTTLFSHPISILFFINHSYFNLFHLYLLTFLSDISSLHLFSPCLSLFALTIFPKYLCMELNEWWWIAQEMFTTTISTACQSSAPTVVLLLE